MMDELYRGYLEDIAFTTKVRSGMQLGAFLMIFPFVALDWFIVRELFSTFLTMRLVAVAVLVICAFLLTRPWGKRHAVALGMVGMLTCITAIAAMVQLMQENQSKLSSYYQGLTIVLVFMPSHFVWHRLASGIVCGFTFLAYLVPTLIRLPLTDDNLQILVTNAFFLGVLAFVVYIGSGIMYDARFNEFVSRLELKKAHGDLQANNKKLLELDRLKNQFFANISHELRTPLTLIMTPLAQLIDATSAGEVRDTLQSMRRNGLKLLRRINELLDFAKLEDGKVRLRLAKVNLVEFLEGIVASARPTAQRRGLTLSYEGPKAPLEAPIDTEQMEKVVLNLVGNAIKFTPGGGHIKVALRDDGEQVLVSVVDTGEGIPPDMLETIFDRFSQVDASPTRRHEGTGLGLAVAREIVELHAGAIWAQSTGRGAGSTFSVRLHKRDAAIPENVRDRRRADRPVTERRRAEDNQPRVPADLIDARQLQLADLERADRPAGSVAAQKHQQTLLVIDDNGDVRNLMRSLLRDDYDVLLCDRAEEGLSILRQKRPNLVVCDVMMPGMDGHSFCRKVREDPEIKRTPIILVTARAGAEMLAQGLDAGADDYVAKPFEPAELKARVRSLLRMAEAEGELARVADNLRIRTADLTKRQRELFLSTVKSLVSALDAKDKYTRNHSLRVTEYSLAIGRKMGLRDSELRDLELASLLHDVGKIGVPEAVLNKPGKLTDEELAQVKQHPVKGEAIIAPVMELKPVAGIVRSHHEQYAGTGYPDGLKELEIPLGARIMGVADAYDAMTSDRPYRRGLTHAAACDEIVRFSGRQFDPEVVQYFLDLADEIRAISAPAAAAATATASTGT